MSRIDSYLKEKYPELSRASIQRLIKEEQVLVNGKTIKASYNVSETDNITLNIPEPKEAKLKAQDIKLEIIYEDNDIAIVNKPKGMVVHPGAGNFENTLANAIAYKCKDSLSGIGGVLRPGIVHRLDKDTSGLLIIAKNDKSHINLSEQMKRHEIEKTYVALVRGVVKENLGTIDMPIGRDNKDRKKMAVTKTGKNAVTHFEVLKRYEKATLLEIKIETGRTHQIRVHMKQIGYPVIGDMLYSNDKGGQMLHAKKLKFKHPIMGNDMELETELPQHFQEVLKQL